MTIDEVLAKSRDLEHFRVVLDGTTGEFLDVSAFEPTQMLKSVSSAPSQFARAVVVVTFSAGQATREKLESKQQGIIRGAEVSRVTEKWHIAPVEVLVHLLEQGNLPFPGADQTIVRHLWQLHRDELSPAIQDRLRALLEPLAYRASRDLKVCLLALAGKSSQLIDLWHSRTKTDTALEYVYALIDALAHVQVQDLQIINEMIDMVERSAWLFGPRFEFAIGLGKLNAAVHTRAAEVIRAVVNDSTPEIIATRDRLLERLTGDPSDWMRCPQCCYGRVHGGSCVAHACPTCLGIGVVPARAQNR